jgi:hypothetical protein
MIGIGRDSIVKHLPNPLDQLPKGKALLGKTVLLLVSNQDLFLVDRFDDVALRF